jgi:hypothetical protein
LMETNVSALSNGLSHILHRYCLLGLFLDEGEAAVSDIIIPMCGHVCNNI